MMPQLNPITWYSEREIKQCPKHFAIATTPITIESKIWILNTLHGRFTIVQKNSGADSVDESDDWVTTLLDTNIYPAFEDPKELLIYELTWT